MMPNGFWSVSLLPGGRTGRSPDFNVHPKRGQKETDVEPAQSKLHKHHIAPLVLFIHELHGGPNSLGHAKESDPQVAPADHIPTPMLDRPH